MNLASQYEPKADVALSWRDCECLDPIGEAETFVILHGWGFDSRVWSELEPVLQRHYRLRFIDLPGFGGSAGADCDYSTASLAKRLSPLIADDSIVLGWSLGGNVALQLCAEGLLQPRALLLFACNPCFIAAKDWPTAMDARVFSRFAGQFEDDSAACTRRFQGLVMHGDGNMRDLRKRIPSLGASLSVAQRRTQAAALECLRRSDARDFLLARQGLDMPVLFVLGAEDALVPVSLSGQLRESGVETVVLEQSSHLIPLQDPAVVAGTVRDFIEQSCHARKIDKKLVARSFSDAAESYDGVAELQRGVAARLLQELPLLGHGKGTAPTRILDLGSGTGANTPALQEHCEDAQVFASDLAIGMLEFARLQGRADTAVCGDAENLAFAGDSFDLVYSSLMVQWCEDLERLFAEVHRVLKPGGCFLFSTLGPNTLFELRQAWQSVDNHTHVNEFAPPQRVQAAASPFKTEAFIREPWCIPYDSLGRLSRELKALGAHNVNSGRPSGLTGSARWRRLNSAYEAWRRDDGSLPASYDVIIGVLRKE